LREALCPAYDVSCEISFAVPLEKRDSANDASLSSSLFLLALSISKSLKCRIVALLKRKARRIDFLLASDCNLEGNISELFPEYRRESGKETKFRKTLERCKAVGWRKQQMWRK
jgi:hypothetical protein